MIKDSEIIEIGEFFKPHGINGEITYSSFHDVDLAKLRCIILKIEGINVPFFIENIRKKGSDNYLVKIDGINNEMEALVISRHDVYALREDVEIEEDESQGYSAFDFVGYTVTDDDTGHTIGVIEDIDDSTENWLFKVKGKNSRLEDKEILIPVADEFITSIEEDSKRLGMSLPEGLID